MSAAAPPLAVVAGLLGLLCAALYLNVLVAPFVGSDRAQITTNARIHWHELTRAHAAEALASPRPVTQLSYGLNFRFGRLDPHDYHAINVALHFANALLVFALGRALFRRAPISAEAAPWAALAGAAVFAAHPLQTEAVTWAAQRASLLAALFGLAALLCHWRARSAAAGVARIALLAASAGCWLLAVGSRESAIVLPIAIWLCEWFFRDDLARGSRARGLPVAVALSAAVALAIGARPETSPAHWLDAARALAVSEGLVVWPAPAHQSLVHALGSSPLGLAAALALQAFLLIGALALARRFRVAAFASLWFLCIHLGEAAFAAPPLAAEHRNYLALVGPALATGYALYAGFARARGLGLASALTLLVVTALGAATHVRNELWRDPETLWSDAVAKSPGDATARLERAALLEQDGRSSEALDDFTEAVRLAPGSARARARLAASLTYQGRERDALPHAREAVALDPGNADAHAALGRIEASLGELEPAAAAFARALELGGDPGVERQLGDTLVRLGRFEESLPHYRAAIERDPGDDDARTGAGAALVELSRADDALVYLEPAVESQPNPRYLSHFADALWQLGEFGSAIDAVTMAVRVAPSWPGAASRLVWMLALSPDAAHRDSARALRIADAAIAQAGSADAPLLDARAVALAALGRFSEARAEAERAARDARDAALAASIASHARSYARRDLPRDPPRPFDPSP